MIKGEFSSLDTAKSVYFFLGYYVDCVQSLTRVPRKSVLLLASPLFLYMYLGENESILCKNSRQVRPWEDSSNNG